MFTPATHLALVVCLFVGFLLSPLFKGVSSAQLYPQSVKYVSSAVKGMLKTCGSNVFYVSSRGSGKKCSDSKPCSLKQALRETRSNRYDCIVLKSGTYKGPIRTRSQRVSYIGEDYKKQRSILRSPSRATTFDIRHSYSDVVGLRINGDKTSHCVRMGNPKTVLRYVSLQGNWIENCKGPGVHVGIRGHVLYRISILDNEIRNTGYAGVGEGIYVGRGGRYRRSIRDVSIERNVIRNFTDNCLDIKSGVSHLLFRKNKCSVQLSALRGRNHGTIVVRGEYNRILDNHIEDVFGGLAVFRVIERGRNLIIGNWVERSFCTRAAVGKVSDFQANKITKKNSVVKGNVFVGTSKKVRVGSGVQVFSNRFHNSREISNRKGCKSVAPRTLPVNF